MAWLTAACLPADIFDIQEVRAIAEKREEQTVLIFGGGGGDVHVLCGPGCDPSQACIPSLAAIVQWIKERQVIFEEAVIVHNHPSRSWYEVVIPSDGDIAATEFLKWQLALLGIKLIDHFIVSGTEKCSLVEVNVYSNRCLKVNGFEIKRFLYCFLVQLSLVFDPGPVGGGLINALEQNMDRVRHYYDKPVWLRLFRTRPFDSMFATQLAGLKTKDTLTGELIRLLRNLEDGKSLQIYTDKVIPYGQELQKRIISRGGIENVGRDCSQGSGN